MNLFEPKTIFLAHHAQHVVVIHFPIALLVASFLFDLLAVWRRSAGFLMAARYNLLGAAMTAVLALGTGVAAWQWQLAGAKLKGQLLFHLVFGASSCGMIWILWFWRRQRQDSMQPMGRNYLLLALVTAILVMMTGHLGGFLSGVNMVAP